MRGGEGGEARKGGERGIGWRERDKEEREG